MTDSESVQRFIFAFFLLLHLKLKKMDLIIFFLKLLDTFCVAFLLWHTDNISMAC